MQTPFLSWLSDQLDAVIELTGTDCPVKAGEEVLGVMSEGLQKLCTVYQNEATSYDSFEREHLLKHSRGEAVAEDCRAFNAAQSVRLDRLKLLKAIFWQEVDEEFNMGGDTDDLGFRQGFQIVRRPNGGRSTSSSVEISFGTGAGSSTLRQIFEQIFHRQ